MGIDIRDLANYRYQNSLKVNKEDYIGKAIPVEELEMILPHTWVGYDDEGKIKYLCNSKERDQIDIQVIHGKLKAVHWTNTDFNIPGEGRYDEFYIAPN